MWHEGLISVLGIGLEYIATFRLPQASILHDAVATLTHALPIILTMHSILIVLLNASLRKISLMSSLGLVGNAWIATAAGAIVLHGLTVLFGAPLTDMVNQTLAFATFLAMLVVMPSVAALGSAPAAIWSKVFVWQSPSTDAEIFAYTQAVCTLSGAWIGAIVLPLDWERDWQVWPVSCVISTFLGHAVGVFAAFVWSACNRMFKRKKN